MSHTAECRILVIASTAGQAQQFVQRVKTLSNVWSITTPSNQTVNNNDQTSTSTYSESTSQVSADSGSESIPWTISNRYYTADVHFETRVFKEFGAHHASGVPAVVYVWSHGETYREHIPRLAKTLEAHDPEVSLAVKFDHEINSSDVKGVVSTTKQVEDEGLDEFLSSHGFEYIDGDRSGRRPTRDGEGFDDEDSSGVPGLPRVIDALSTIMWPSLVQSESTRQRKSRARELLEWAKEEEGDDGLQALVSPFNNVDEHAGGGHQTTLDAPKKSRMQREMEELERWLEQEEQDQERRKIEEDNQAWVLSDQNESRTEMPTPTIRTPQDNGGDGSGFPFGFDDDFDEFVGAPLNVEYDGHQGRRDSGRLVPMHTGASYRSLASVDDIGGWNHGAFGDKEEETDADLPSEKEIEETSRRIFGSAHLNVPKPNPSRPELAITTADGHPPTSSSTSSSHSFHPPDSPFSSFVPDGEDIDDDFDLGPFDLSRVLRALQGMKEEISGMEDEGERRKAAARVALGLVYGLKREEEREEEVERESA